MTKLYQSVKSFTIPIICPFKNNARQQSRDTHLLFFYQITRDNFAREQLKQTVKIAL